MHTPTPFRTPSRSLLRATITTLSATVAFSAFSQTATPKEQIARICTLYACSHFAKEVASVQEKEELRANLQKRVTPYSSKAAAQ